MRKRNKSWPGGKYSNIEADNKSLWSRLMKTETAFFILTSDVAGYSNAGFLIKKAG
jgi:hypothetical protein